jgi:hypothetical protein
MAFLGQIAVEPIATGTHLIHKDAGGGLGWHRSDQPIEVTLPRADGAQKAHFGPVILGHIGDGDGLLVDLHADIKGGQLGQG